MSIGKVHRSRNNVQRYEVRSLRVSPPEKTTTGTESASAKPGVTPGAAWWQPARSPHQLTQ